MGCHPGTAHSGKEVPGGREKRGRPSLLAVGSLPLPHSALEAPLKRHSPPPAPGNHSSAFCVCGFAYPGHFMYVYTFHAICDLP